MKATSSRSGFGIVEGILVVVVLAIIVGLGYVFINRPTDTPESTTGTSTTSRTSAETSSIQGDLDSMDIDATLDTTDIDATLE